MLIDCFGKFLLSLNGFVAFDYDFYFSYGSENDHFWSLSDVQVSRPLAVVEVIVKLNQTAKNEIEKRVNIMSDPDVRRL